MLETHAFRDGQAQWVWTGERRGKAARHNRSHYEVRWFRRVFEAPEGATLRLAVTADSRYRLFLNGQLVSRGPAKGDVAHHFFDVIELAECLLPGRNVLSAQVMDYSRVDCDPPIVGAPASVMTAGGGFAADGAVHAADGAMLEPLATPGAWQACLDDHLEFHAEGNWIGGFVGYFERLHASPALAALRLGADELPWGDVLVLGGARRIEEMRDESLPYGLMQRMIPALEEHQRVEFARAFLPGGEPAGPEWLAMLRGEAPLVVPAGERREVILDAGAATTAFIEVDAEGAPGALLRVAYAEGLTLPYGTPGAAILGHPEGLDRVSTGTVRPTEGWTMDARGEFCGWHDEVLWQAPLRVAHEPFHWRTFRFVKLTIEASGAPVVLHRLGARFTAYPFPARALLRTSSELLNRVVDTSWRTARLCCHETYEDCPYYEQLQYPGDFQITSQVVLAFSGDARLTRQALLQVDWSRLPEGISRAQYPSRVRSVIPSWSLHWILAIHDYWMATGDGATVGRLATGIDAVLRWFDGHRGASGLPGKLPFWNCTDWCPEWDRGAPPGWDRGPTCVIACQWVATLDAAAELLEAVEPDAASRWREQAARARESIRAQFWDAAKGLFRDCPDEALFSQYGNAWALLCGAAEPWQQALVAPRLLDASLSPASFFGLHAVGRALLRAGQPALTEGFLAPWREMLDAGLTTWAEESTYWRSLCHAWSASPMLLLVEEALGVRPLEPGFARILVEPRPRGLASCDGTIATPRGPVRVAWSIDGEAGRLSVSWPGGVPCEIRVPDGAVIESASGSEKIPFSPAALVN